MSEKSSDWAKAKALFLAALDMEKEERDRFLENACRSKPKLRHEVERLFEEHASEDSFLDGRLIEGAGIWSEEETKLEGTRLRHYELRQLLGKGGMGAVYEAHDGRLGRDVAVKVLRNGLSLSSQALRRFEREARAVGALRHPGIVQVFAVEECEGIPFFVMERLHGKTLDASIGSSGIPEAAFLELARPLADAVAAAHDAGVIHRDLKPANVMITEAGEVKVLDFGLAKLKMSEAQPDRISTAPSLTIEGMVMGTPSYMSPEQVLGEATDERSDVWSLGVLFYEMLCGIRPFEGATNAETLAKVLDAKPAPILSLASGVSPRLARIVHRCLERDPKSRYPNAKALHEALGTLSFRKGLAGFPTASPRVWTLVLYVLVNLPVFAVVLAHYPNWDARFLRILQSSPGQYAFQIFLFPFIAYFTVAGLGELRTTLARARSRSPTPVPRTVAESRRAVFAFVLLSGALLSVAAMDEVPGVDQLPPEAARAVALGREVILSAVSEANAGELALMMERERTLSPALVEGLALPREHLTPGSYVRSLSFALRERVNADPSVRLQVIFSSRENETSEAPGLLESIARAQVWMSPQIGMGSDSTLYRNLQFANLAEMLVLLYVEVVLSLGAMSILGTRARLGRNAAVLARPAAAFAFAVALLSTWTVLRAYTIYEEDLLYPRPEGVELWIPYATFAFCLATFAFLSGELLDRQPLAFVVSATTLAIAGYCLFTAESLVHPIRLSAGVASSLESFAVTVTFLLGFPTNLAYWWRQMGAPPPSG